MSSKLNDKLDAEFVSLMKINLFDQELGEIKPGAAAKGTFYYVYFGSSLQYRTLREGQRVYKSMSAALKDFTPEPTMQMYRGSHDPDEGSLHIEWESNKSGRGIVCCFPKGGDEWTVEHFTTMG